jgi:hypothetical protein
MKKLLGLIGLMLAVACGEVPDGGPDDGSADAAELGQAREALVAGDAYGIDQAGNRCWTPSGWAGNMCRIPNGVHWTLVIPDANDTLGCDADMRVGISNAAVYFKNHLNAMNWNIEVFTPAECPTCGTQAKTAVVQCKSSGAPGPNVIGNTPMMEASTAACLCGDFCGGSCIDGPDGDFVSVNSLPDGVMIYKQNFATKSWYTGATSTARRRFTRNVALHEFFHIAGLGHDTFAETPLMGLGASPLGIQQALVADYNPTSFEDSMLRCNNPNRNGLFPLNPSQCL